MAEGNPPRVVRRRRRKCRACDSCFRKKIKCDSAVPQCNWCHHHDLLCSYSRNATQATHRQAPTCSASTTPRRSVKLYAGNSTTQPAPGEHLRIQWFAVFLPSGRQWIQAQTGEVVSLSPYPPSRRVQALKSPANHPLSSNETASLPDKETVYNHLRLYTSSVFSQIFPFISPPLFERTIETAYCQQDPPDCAIATARACVFAFMSVASVASSNDLNDEQISNIDYYASQAYHLLPIFFGNSITIDCLEAILMLCFYSQAVAGDLLSMEILLCSATRLVFHLQGNPHPSKVDIRSPQANRHIRNLFWICYCFNHEATMRTGLPPSIDDRDCDLTLPVVPECPSVFLLFIRLAIVYSHIYRRLYAPSAMGQTDAELLCTIRELDGLLEEWKLLIPASTRPTFRRRPTDAESMTSSVFQLQYHYCMATIHQASGRCKFWTGNRDTRRQGSSLVISVAASRSLLRKFFELELQFHQYNLLFYLPYLTAAMIHLFCNILLNPLDWDSKADLELVMMAPARVSSPEWPQARAAFHMQIDYVNGLASEIHRLAHSAIARAGTNDR
ncbi:putative C6 transcription factor [Aspergillus desertorum]